MTPDDGPKHDNDKPVAGRTGQGVDSVLPHLRKQQQQQPQQHEEHRPEPDAKTNSQD